MGLSLSSRELLLARSVATFILLSAVRGEAHFMYFYSFATIVKPHFGINYYTKIRPESAPESRQERIHKKSKKKSISSFSPSPRNVWLETFFFLMKFIHTTTTQDFIQHIFYKRKETQRERENQNGWLSAVHDDDVRNIFSEHDESGERRKRLILINWRFRCINKTMTKATESFFY